MLDAGSAEPSLPLSLADFGRLGWGGLRTLCLSISQKSAFRPFVLSTPRVCRESAMSPLVNPASLFSFRLSCPRRKKLWPPAAWDLDTSCRLPSLAAVAGVPDLLELWVAWNEDGLAVRAIARGIGSSLWCQPTRPEDSDGVHLWIATHPTGESHRAGRYCSRLALLPTGGGLRADKPIAVAAVIPRTSELPAPLPETAVLIESTINPDGWQIDAFVTAAAMPGWDPLELPCLGFFAALVDRRLGQIPSYAPPEFPWTSDPTTWAELKLL
jgi:hypothetical protein